MFISIFVFISRLILSFSKPLLVGRYQNDSGMVCAFAWIANRANYGWIIEVLFVYLRHHDPRSALPSSICCVEHTSRCCLFFLEGVWTYPSRVIFTFKSIPWFIACVLFRLPRTWAFDFESSSSLTGHPAGGSSSPVPFSRLDFLIISTHLSRSSLWSVALGQGAAHSAKEDYTPMANINNSRKRFCIYQGSLDQIFRPPWLILTIVLAADGTMAWSRPVLIKLIHAACLLGINYHEGELCYLNYPV